MSAATTSGNPRSHAIRSAVLPVCVGPRSGQRHVPSVRIADTDSLSNLHLRQQKPLTETERTQDDLHKRHSSKECARTADANTNEQNSMPRRSSTRKTNPRFGNVDVCRRRDEDINDPCFTSRCRQVHCGETLLPQPKKSEHIFQLGNITSQNIKRRIRNAPCRAYQRRQSSPREPAQLEHTFRHRCCARD